MSDFKSKARVVWFELSEDEELVAKVVDCNPLEALEATARYLEECSAEYVRFAQATRLSDRKSWKHQVHLAQAKFKNLRPQPSEMLSHELDLVDDFCENPLQAARERAHLLVRHMPWQFPPSLPPATMCS